MPCPAPLFFSAVVTVPHGQQDLARVCEWFPPSISRLPSQPDPREPSPEQLEQIIRRLPLKKGEEDNSAAEARELLAGYASARLGQLWQRKRKSGAAGPKVVRDLKQIASRSSTLLERLKRADRNTFEAWDAAQ